MATSARRGFSKVIKRCPYCGKKGPKELVEGPKRVRWTAFIVSFLLCCVPVLFFPLWYNSSLEVYCDECGKSFDQ